MKPHEVNRTLLESMSEEQAELFKLLTKLGHDPLTTFFNVLYVPPGEVAGFIEHAKKLLEQRAQNLPRSTSSM